ncbi:hypothetical protein PoB_001960400 [Plakobranchus ocellatus]|uniref:Uncharacterized protein n=1 Tax=Plakobranchus ocellatus TaxID=259542 RepID=A0AAV3ZGT9_9GAST|nr:hypothetical protein PoB_001960400 [Plakobranchus ocellatus]
MVLSPRIDFNSLWISKGDLSATFADPLELIIIHFLNVTSSQREIHSSVWESPLPSSCWQQRHHHELLLDKASSPRRDMRKGQGFLLSHEEVLNSASGSSTKWHIARNSSAVPGLPWSYTSS